MGDEGRVGPYRLVERLGRGGMGEVWLAEDPTGASGGAPRRVALKLLDPRLLDDPGARARFAREVAAARRVRGAAVAALLDADVEADHPWLASAYVAGPTLADHVDRHGPLAPAPLRALGASLADALVAIHGAGVVHRDLTPRNVVLGPDGPRVVDFGIAWIEGAPAITQTGSWVGTPAWMPPERFSDRPVTAASDVWSWGAVMAYAARGRPAIDGPAPAAVERAARGAADLDGVPGWLEPTVRAAMAPDPASRPTAAGLRAAMAGGNGPPGGAPGPAPAAPPPTGAGAAAGRAGDATTAAIDAGDADTVRWRPATTRRFPGPPRREGESGGGRRGAGTAGRAGGVAPAAGVPDRPGRRRVARWSSGALVLAGAAAIGLVGGLLVVVIATAVLVMAAVALALAREGSPPGARPVPPTWTVGLAGPVALGVGMARVLGPVWGAAAVVVLVVVFVLLGGDIA
ncbi:MAG TPA: protein kinase [Acidimicrobiales bacterium]